MNFPRNLVLRTMNIAYSFCIFQQESPRLKSVVFLTCLVLLFHPDKYSVSAAEPISVFSFIHDLIQYNVAGIPLIHERTEWNFDPEVGKQRRVNYEQENGRHGEIAIERIGMGVGYKGPWGTPA